MGRKRTELPPGAAERIETLMRRGDTAKAIAATLRAEGVAISEATVGRRLLELRGHVRVAKSPEARATVAAVLETPDELEELPRPDAIPDGASLSQLDKWIAQAEQAIKFAEGENNLPLMGQMLRVAASLAETRRKATPPEKPDPNDSPDMVKLGAETRERLHKMVEIVAGEKAA